jgi:serine/threonine-protein phosphatase 2A activator
MYLNCIRFIKIAKKGVAFSESSPILHNISGAANWYKVTAGLPKMYKAEVLGKHPVIKHQYFGTIIPFK